MKRTEPVPEPALELDEEPGSRLARLRAYAGENAGTVALIAVVAVIELFIVVMLVRAL